MPEKFKALCELVADVPAYPGRLPETAELPAVSFFMVSRVTTRCLEDVVDSVTENWQVRVSAARQMEAREIAKRFYRLDGRKTAIYQRIVIDSDSDEPAATLKEDGFPLPGVPLTLTTTAGTLNQSEATTNALGQVAATLKNNAAGAVTVTATYGAVQKTLNITFTA